MFSPSIIERYSDHEKLPNEVCYEDYFLQSLSAEILEEGLLVS